MTAINVMVVEDSPVASDLIVATLNSDPRLEVICTVDCAEKALRLIPRTRPDIICMDIRLPGMDGIEATRRIMADFPTPIVVVAADLRSETINRTMEALNAGALSVVEKPSLESVDAYRAMQRRLCNQFVGMSQMKLVRRRFNGDPCASPSRLARAGVPGDARPVEVVGVVASTGGPAAVAAFLKGLEPDFTAPVLLVQHMGAEFLAGYAGWLDGLSARKVTPAEDLQHPQPGCVHVAPGRHHLICEHGRMRLLPDDDNCGHVPGGDVLLRSLARSYGPRAVGIVLTGMGDDGARGLLAMRQAGARTIVQDEASSAVYGMPAVAKRLGAAELELPVELIASQLRRIARVSKLRQSA